MNLYYFRVYSACSTDIYSACSTDNYFSDRHIYRGELPTYFLLFNLL